MDNKIKYILLLIVFLVSFISFRFLFLKKDIDNPLPEVKLKPIVEKEKAMAIMVSNDGSNYQEYTEDTWPGDNYKFKEAKCMDNNGSLVDEDIITFENDTVTLETNQTVYCTLYFDYKGTINILRENDPNKVLSSTEVGGMYRYQGVGTEEGIDDIHKFVDNNYICFGATNKEECTNNEEKYMYRIIGITKDNKLYLIKMKGIEEGNNKIFQWNFKYQQSECVGEACEWPNADIYKRLNGEASNGKPVFINNDRYDYMKEGNLWYKKIENSNWMYGDVDHTISTTQLGGETIYGVQNNGLIIYDIETGVKPTQHREEIDDDWIYVKHQWSIEKSVPAKIGLMYLHDYYLAYDNERNWNNTYDKNNWLHIDNNNNTTGSSDEWLMSRRGGILAGLYGTWYVVSDGSVFTNNLIYSCVIRPTFYLSSTVNIKSGTGSINEPYILDIN